MNTPAHPNPSRVIRWLLDGKHSWCARDGEATLFVFRHPTMTGHWWAYSVLPVGDNTHGPFKTAVQAKRAAERVAIAFTEGLDA